MAASFVFSGDLFNGHRARTSPPAGAAQQYLSFFSSYVIRLSGIGVGPELDRGGASCAKRRFRSVAADFGLAFDAKSVGTGFEFGVSGVLIQRAFVRIGLCRLGFGFVRFRLLPFGSIAAISSWVRASLGYLLASPLTHGRIIGDLPSP